MQKKDELKNANSKSKQQEESVRRPSRLPCPWRASRSRLALCNLWAVNIIVVSVKNPTTTAMCQSWTMTTIIAIAMINTMTMTMIVMAM